MRSHETSCESSCKQVEWRLTLPFLCFRSLFCLSLFALSIIRSLTFIISFIQVTWTYSLLHTTLSYHSLLLPCLLINKLGMAELLILEFWVPCVRPNYVWNFDFPLTVQWLGSGTGWKTISTFIVTPSTETQDTTVYSPGIAMVIKGHLPWDHHPLHPPVIIPQLGPVNHPLDLHLMNLGTEFKINSFLLMKLPLWRYTIILLLVLINRPQIWIIFIQRSFTTILYHPGVHQLPILIRVHLPLLFMLLKDISFFSSLLVSLSISMRLPLFYPLLSWHYEVLFDTMQSPFFFWTLCSPLGYYEIHIFCLLETWLVSLYVRYLAPLSCPGHYAVLLSNKYYVICCVQNIVLDLSIQVFWHVSLFPFFLFFLFLSLSLSQIC